MYIVPENYNQMTSNQTIIIRSNTCKRQRPSKANRRPTLAQIIAELERKRRLDALQTAPGEPQATASEGQ